MSKLLDVKSTSWFRRINLAQKQGFFNYQDIADSRKWDSSPSYEFSKGNRNAVLVPQDKMLVELELAFMDAVSGKLFNECILLIERMIIQTKAEVLE